MARNTPQQEQPLIRLTPPEVKRLRRAKGFKSAAAVARMIHKHRGTVIRLEKGEIGGELREWYAKFLGIPENQLPPVKKTRLGIYIEPENGGKGNQ